MTTDNHSNSKSAPKMDRRPLEDRKVAILTILDVIRSKRHFFYLTLSLTLVGTLLGHYLKVSTYQTTARLFVQDIDQPSAAEYLLNKANYKMPGSERVESYVNHLKSDTFLLRVAEKIKFDKNFSSLNLISPSKKSKLNLSYWKNKLVNNPDDDNFTNERETKLLMPVETIAGFLRKNVQYNFEYNSQFISITVNTLDPMTSQLIANLIAEEFVEITNQVNLNDVKEIEEFVKTKKAETEEQVRNLDKELIAFKQKNKILTTQLTTSNYASRLAKLDLQVQDVELEIKQKSKRLKYLDKKRESSLNEIFRDGSRSQNFANDETSFILQSRIEQLKKEKSAYLAQGIEENNWRIEKINQQIDENLVRLKSVISKSSQEYSNLDPQKAKEKIAELQDEVRNLKARLTTLKSARAQLAGEVNLLPSIQQDYVKLENQFNVAVENLSNLERKEKELEIQKISYKKEVRVDQLAELPGPMPRGNIFMKLIFSSMASIFLGLLIVLGLESLDPTVKSRQDLYDCGLDFVGELPFVHKPEKPKKRQGRFQFGSPDDLVCKLRPESVESMSFKYMRARIESMRYKEKKSCQVIALSSAMHNEGKSFVAANLAISLSQLNRRVLLIDADLRRPSQSAYFGISTQTGLTDLLAMKKDLSDVLVTDQMNNLHILPAGISGNDSTELISSQKFRLLLEYLRNEYEYIVVDTPPTFAVVDAAIVAGISDVPILVSSFRNTRKADLYEAYNDLLQVSYKNVFGVINKAIVSNSRIHYYGYPLYDKSAPEVSAFNRTGEDDAAEFLEKLKRTSNS